MQSDRCNVLMIGLPMDSPTLPIEMPASDKRETFIAVVKDCVPSGDRDNFTASVHELLKKSGIHEAPKVISSYGCSFTIDLLQEQYDQLSNSEDVTLSSDHNLTIR